MLRALVIALLFVPRIASSQPTIEGAYTLLDKPGYSVVFKSGGKNERYPRCDADRSAVVDGWRGELLATYRGEHIIIRNEEWAVRFVDATRVVAVRPRPKDSDHRLEILLMPKGDRASAGLLYWGLDKDGKEFCVTGIGLTGDYAP